MPATLKELGEQLREARESRKLSMQEASEITKISKRILTSFEQADIDQFPHPVYAKGFIKNYAKLLGLDAEEFGRAMGQALGGQEGASEPMGVVECPAGPDPLRMASLESERKRSWPTVLLLLLLVALLAVLVWYLLIRPADAPPDLIGAMEEAVEPAPAQPAAQPAPQSEEPLQAEPEAAPATTVEAGADAETVAPQPTAAAQADNQLRIKSRDQEGSWIGVYDNDGQTLLRDFTVTDGGEISFVLAQPRSLRIGRVQGVEVWYGGELVELDGVGTRNIKLPPAP